jgi:hypothetical protein
MRKRDKILEPDRLELELRAKLSNLGRHFVINEIVAGDNGDRDVAVLDRRPQTSQEAQAIHEWHSEVKDDRVGAVRVGFL